MHEIFISYRKSDAGHFPEIVFNRLRARFGNDSVFLDRERLEGGRWEDGLRTALSEARVVLVLVGGAWRTTPDPITGKPKKRLLDDKDVVRCEVEEGLKPGVGKLVLPVLLGEEKNVPDFAESEFLQEEPCLPVSLRALVGLQSVRLKDGVEGLEQGLRDLESKVRGQLKWPKFRDNYRIPVALLALLLLLVLVISLVTRNHSETPTPEPKTPPATLATTDEDGFTSTFFGKEDEDSTAADSVRYLKAALRNQANSIIQQPPAGGQPVPLGKDEALIRYILSSPFADPYRPFRVDVTFGKGNPFISVGFLVRESPQGKVLFPLRRTEEIFPDKNHCTFQVPASLKGDRIVVILAMRDSDFKNFVGKGDRFKMVTLP